VIDNLRRLAARSVARCNTSRVRSPAQLPRQLRQRSRQRPRQPSNDPAHVRLLDALPNYRIAAATPAANSWRTPPSRLRESRRGRASACDPHDARTPTPTSRVPRPVIFSFFLSRTHRKLVGCRGEVQPRTLSQGVVSSVADVSKSLGFACPRCKTIMDEVVRIAPLASEPGLIGYECPACCYVTSVPLQPESPNRRRPLP
jgi:hypothetical protein